ncbi:hypothetical protein ABK040_000695 [Willaertia magna]
MFEKSLQDLVKGIRANKSGEEVYIRNAINEIKDELKSNDIKKKATGVQKLTYLHMLGYDMNWAAFHILEVMSSPIFAYKKIGYLAASLSFTPQTDVILLTHQLFRKELKSLNQYESGLAVTCISNIATNDLAKDLASEILTLFQSGKQYVRKKAVLCMYKIFLQYPDALRPSFPKLKEKLSDSHPSVVSSSVNVICELARKNPKNYLSMAPAFYKLLTNINNNWTLIKIVKLFGALTPHEPRLAKKLVEPLANIINSTPAKSLLYECLLTVTIGLKEHTSIVKLAVEKLKQFVEEKDQNLKYLGLLGLNNLLSKYPKVIADMKDTIMDCLEDQDTTIRYRALDLLCGVVNQKNIKGIINKLMKILEKSEGEYRDFLVERIITSCSKDNYSAIANFKWYLDILIQLTNVKSAIHGKLIATHLMDVLIRVKSLRSHGVNEMIKLLSSPLLSTESSETSSVFEVLYAASFVIGEFITQADINYKEVLQKLLQPQTQSLPDRIKSCYIQAITKIYSAACAKGVKLSSTANTTTNATTSSLNDILGFDNTTLTEENEPVVNNNANINNNEEEEMNHTEVNSQLLKELREIIRDGLQKYFNSTDVEVQERTNTCLSLIEIHESLEDENENIGPEIESIFIDELKPVVIGSQEQVPIPDGLDLDRWIGKTWDSLVDESVFNQIPSSIALNEFNEYNNEFDINNNEEESNIPLPSNSYQLNDTYQQNKQVFILRSDNKKKTPTGSNTSSPQQQELKKKKKTTSGGTKKKKATTTVQEIEEPMQVSTDFEQLEGVEFKNNKTVGLGNKQDDDPLSKIDLTNIGKDEVLPSIQAYPVGTSPIMPVSSSKKKKEETGTTTKKKKGTTTIKKKKAVKEGSEELEEQGTTTTKKKKKTATASGVEGNSEEKKKKKKSTANSVTGEEGTVTKKKKSTSGNAKKVDAAKQVLDFFDNPTPINDNTTTTNGSASKKKTNSKSKGLKRICRDDNVRIGYHTKVQPSDSNNITIPLVLENLNNQQDITQITYHVDSTMNFKFIKPLNQNVGPLRALFSLGPGDEDNIPLNFNFQSINRQQQVTGYIDYCIGNDKKRLDFSLKVPSSMFFAPKRISQEDFMNLVKMKELPCVTSTNCLLNDKIDNVNVAAKEVARLLRLTVVESVGDTYQMYGCSCQNNHLAVLVKSKNEKTILVDLRTADDNLSTSLLQEVALLFKQ